MRRRISADSASYGCGYLTVRLTLALCVNPPVAGAPLPNVPVKVRVYVPAVVLVLVPIVAVLLTLPDPVRDTGLEEKPQVPPLGAPPQESATLPVKPPTGAKVMV